MRHLAWLSGLMILAPAASWAEPAIVSWPTFFYEGPSKQYRVIDELDRGQLVEVQACSAGWCKVTSDKVAGFIDQASLRPDTPPPSTPAIDGMCFNARSDGYEKGEVWRYCPQKAP